MSSYAYPELSLADIISALQHIQIPVTEKDFRNPKADFFADLFTRLLVHIGLLNDNGELDGQLEFQAIEHLDNPEHHYDAIKLMTLYLTLKKLLSSIRYPKGFTLLDLLRPQNGRCEHVLGAILNYILYKKVKMERLRTLMEEVTYLEEQESVSEAKIAKLNEEYANIVAEREQDGPIVQELTSKAKEIRAFVAKLSTEQEQLRNSFQHLKEEANQKNEEIAKAEFGLVQSVQENAILRSKIVQSPDKLQTSLKDKKSVLQEVSDSEKCAKEAFHTKTVQRKLLAKALKKLTKQQKLMQSVQDKKNSAKTIEKELKTLKVKLSEEEAINKSLSLKVTELEEKVQQQNAMKEMEEEEANKQKEEAFKKFADLRNEVELRRQDLQANQKSIESLLSKADDMKAEEALLMRNRSAEIEKMIQQREVVVVAFHRYKKRINEKFNLSR